MGNNVSSLVEIDSFIENSIERDAGNTHPVVRDGKVMDHGNDWGNHPDHLGKFAVRTNIIVANIWRAVSFGFISKADHIPSLRIELGMRGERRTRQLAIEVI